MVAYRWHQDKTEGAFYVVILALQFLFLIGYVAGSVAFPKPLTPEEEEDCLRRMRQGDEEARNELIERNMRLVAHIVRKYSTQGIGCWETDDLISVGSIGLIKGISTYRPDKNTRLSTYLARCIENELLMLLRSDKKVRNEVSLQDPIGQDKEGNTLTLMDVLEYEDEDVLEKLDSRLKRRQILKCMEEVLDEREQKVVMMRYGLDGKEPKTQKETAGVLGVSRSYISRIEKKALEKLKKNLRIDNE